jgi:hypothetical protein
MGDFANPRGHDWHLKAHAAAINKASRTDFPALDRDGHVRSGVADAGAYEYGTGPPKSGSGGGKAGKKRRVIRRVHLTHKRICHRVTASCRVRLTKVRIQARAPGGVIVQVRKAGGRHKLVRTIRKPLRGRSGMVPLKGRRYARGRYRVVVVVVAAGTRQRSRVMQLKVV